MGICLLGCDVRQAGRAVGRTAAKQRMNSELYELGEQTADERNPQRVIECSTRILQHDPHSADALRLRAAAYAAIGRIDLAVADLDRLVEVAPNEADAWARRAGFRHLTKEMELAVADLNRAIELDQRQAKYYALRAATFCEMRKHNEALADARAAIELQPDNRTAITSLYRTLAALEAWDELLRLADQMAASKVCILDDYVVLGAAHVQVGQLEKAIEVLTQGLQTAQRGPADVQSPISAARASKQSPERETEATGMLYLSRAQAYDQLGEVDKALADLSEAIAVDPNRRSAYERRAHMYYLLGEEEKRRQDLRQVARLNRRVQPEPRRFESISSIEDEAAAENEGLILGVAK